MKIIKSSYELRFRYKELVYIKRDIESAARTCYKSENNMSLNSYDLMIPKLIRLGHESMLEHGSISIKFICDRAIANEITRHRIFSFAQESTRYCNYHKDRFNNEITVINPYNNSTDIVVYKLWERACIDAERAYFDLLELGERAEIARNVLPLSLKTELVVTGNIRQWRSFFKLRCSGSSHPQMRALTRPLLKELAKNEHSEILFADIYNEMCKKINAIEQIG